MELLKLQEQDAQWRCVMQDSFSLDFLKRFCCRVGIPAQICVDLYRVDMRWSLLKLTTNLLLVLSIHQGHWLAAPGTLAQLFLWLTIIWTTPTPAATKSSPGQEKDRSSNAWVSRLFFHGVITLHSLVQGGRAKASLREAWAHPWYLSGLQTMLEKPYVRSNHKPWLDASKALWILHTSSKPFLFLNWHFYKVLCYLISDNYIAV